jgi:hypothetical protein
LDDEAGHLGLQPTAVELKTGEDGPLDVEAGAVDLGAEPQSGIEPPIRRRDAVAELQRRRRGMEDELGGRIENQEWAIDGGQQGTDPAVAVPPRRDRRECIGLVVRPLIDPRIGHSNLFHVTPKRSAFSTRASPGGMWTPNGIDTR